MWVRSIPVLLVCVVLGFSQQGPPPVVSPEVHPDNRVTFRLLAPKASEVALTGDWFTGSQAMTKDDAGVWSVTLDPLEPSIYIYGFTLDGVAINDPVNPRVKLRARTAGSLVEVPDNPPALWQARDVPHGLVELNWVKSKPLDGETRRVAVYTPPGYAENRNRRYPVLYLFHGNNGTEMDWTTGAQANLIFDNLIAENRMVPMLVVMPWGHAAPYGSRETGDRSNNALFERHVIEDVMPLVESKYRIVRGRENRAVAGLSMGGGHSLLIGLAHLDLFSAIGAFSAAVPGDIETRFAEVLSDAEATNKRLKLFWFACGRQDGLFSRSEQLAALLEKNGIRHTFVAADGVHNFTIWRKHIIEFAPLLFR